MTALFYVLVAVLFYVLIILALCQWHRTPASPEKEKNDASENR